MKTFFRENGLSLVLIVITIATLMGQIVVGWHELNSDLQDFGRPTLPFAA